MIEGPVPYEVEYTPRARQRIRDLAAIARQREDEREFVEALKEFQRRLAIFPQFGEQLVDLTQVSGQIWVGIVRPLSMRYTVLDEQRLVMIAALPVLLPQDKP